jgi:hypothetical protein
MDYYDKANRDRFDDIFRDLYIGKHPTSSRTSLLVLRFDFSTVSGAHTSEDMKQQFDRVVNGELKRFLTKNRAFLGGPDLTLVDESNGTKSLEDVLVSRGVFSLSVLSKISTAPGRKTRGKALRWSR